MRSKVVRKILKRHDIVGHNFDSLPYRRMLWVERIVDFPRYAVTNLTSGEQFIDLTVAAEVHIANEHESVAKVNPTREVASQLLCALPLPVSDYTATYPISMSSGNGELLAVLAESYADRDAILDGVDQFVGIRSVGRPMVVDDTLDVLEGAVTPYCGVLGLSDEVALGQHDTDGRAHSADEMIGHGPEGDVRPALEEWQVAVGEVL